MVSFVVANLGDITTRASQAVAFDTSWSVASNERFAQHNDEQQQQQKYIHRYPARTQVETPRLE